MGHQRNQIAFLLLLLPLACFAQPRRLFNHLAPNVTSSNFWATNYPNCVANWIADNSQKTGASNAVDVVTNLVSGGPSLTNLDAANTWPKATNSLNGHTTLWFDGSNDYLQTDIVNYTNYQPHEIWLVAKWWAAAGGDVRRAFGGASGTYDHPLTTTTTNYFRIVGNSSLVMPETMDQLTNRWVVWRMIFNGANSIIETNGAVAKAGTTGAACGISGFTLGANALHAAQFGKVEIAEVATFSATNSTANTAAILGGFLAKYATNNFLP